MTKKRSGKRRFGSFIKATALAGLLRGASKRAQHTLRDPAKMQALANDAMRHAQAAEKQGGLIAATLAPLALMARLGRAYARREYRSVPWATVAAMVAALVYFVMPFDFLPDILAGFGFTDDMALLAFVMHQVKGDLDKFALWEQAHSPVRTVDGQATPALPAAAALDSGAMDDIYVGEPPTDVKTAAESAEAIQAILDATTGTA